MGKRCPCFTRGSEQKGESVLSQSHRERDDGKEDFLFHSS